MTEKDYAPQRKESKKIVVEKPKDVPKVKSSITNKKEEQKTEEKPKTEEKKKPIQKKPVVKKTEAFVNYTNVPISTKHCIAVCKFINKKKIEDAINDLEKVTAHKKAVPMKGEIPHRKGKGMMSGRYPKKATEQFIKLLKNLLANSNANELEEPIIVEAVANIGSRPFGKFGRVRKKRTHIKIRVIEKKLISKNKKERNNGRKKRG